MKANIFNTFFAEQCTPLRSGSVLPVNQMFFDSSKTKIFRFQRSRNSEKNKSIKHKAHGYDISIRMVKICDKSLLKPLILLFKNYISIFLLPRHLEKI